jgi:hypothetical protein
VLRSSPMMDADGVRDGRILFAVGGDVDQRAGAAPIFLGRV